MSSLEQIQTALSFFRAGLLDEAKEACQALLEEDPSEPSALRLLGQIFYLERDLPQAVKCLEVSLAQKSDQFFLWIKLGNIYSDLGQYDQSRQSYEKAIALEPTHHLGHYWQGQALANEGDLDAAFKAYETAIKLNPEFGPAYRLIVKTNNPWTKSKIFKDDLELRAINNHIPAEDRIHMHFALAEIFEAQEKHGLMMAHLKLANGLQKNRTPDWRPAMEKLSTAMQRLYSSEWGKWTHPPRGKSPIPVLIVGAHRSGSALLDAMISTHPQVTSGGETAAIPLIQKDIQNNYTMRDFPDGIGDLTEPAFAALSSRLIESYTSMADGCPFVTDKLLSNGLTLGLTQTLVPWLKVLYIKRNLEDTALSIFKNYFFEKTAPYLCSLDNIGFYMAEYENMMNFWQKKLPETIHEINYEALVQNPEAELKKVFAFLGLPWDPICLSFYKTPHNVRNLSQTQQPLHQRSIGQGQKFLKDFEIFDTAYQNTLKKL